MTETKLYDLTRTNVALEMYRQAGDPLADPGFRRHVSAVTTEDQRQRTAERMQKARGAA